MPVLPVCLFEPLWVQFAALLPERPRFSPSHPLGCHRQRIDHRVVFEVEDECGGLPVGSIEKLFDPYVQVGKDRSGFGLGLAIAKQAVDAHQGSLRVHNIVGSGCVFVLELPTHGPGTR